MFSLSRLRNKYGHKTFLLLCLVKAFFVNSGSLGRSLKYIAILCVILLFFHNYMRYCFRVRHFHLLHEYVPWYIKVVKESIVLCKKLRVPSEYTVSKLISHLLCLHQECSSLVLAYFREALLSCVAPEKLSTLERKCI